MKQRVFKKFQQDRPTLDQIASYMRNEHGANLDDLLVILSRLTFTENFNCFRVTVTIPATSEVAIENKLRGTIPTDKIITRTNSSEVVDGDAAWTQEFVTLKNLGATAATVTVLFLR